MNTRVYEQHGDFHVEYIPQRRRNFLCRWKNFIASNEGAGMVVHFFNKIEAAAWLHEYRKTGVQPEFKIDEPKSEDPKPLTFRQKMERDQASRKREIERDWVKDRIKAFEEIAPQLSEVGENFASICYVGADVVNYDPQTLEILGWNDDRYPLLCKKLDKMGVKYNLIQGKNSLELNVTW